MLRFNLLLLISLLPGLASANSLQQLEKELASNKYASAATTGLSMLRESPDDTQVKFLTAVALQKNNQPLLAKKYYQQIIKTHPKLPEPRNNLAMIYLQQGQHDQAVDLLITSLKTHPAYATAWLNLSNVYRGLASEAYRRALSEEKDPSSVVHKIQLTALTSLHSLPKTTPALQPENKPVQLAKIQEPEPKKVKPVKQITAMVDDNPPMAKMTSESALIKLVQDWANAWSNKDFKSYLNSYTMDFKGRKANHEQWRQYRKSRINRPGKINIQLSNIRVKSQTQNQVIIDFHQAYSSPNYSDKVVKRLYLSKSGNQWKISRENTLAVL